MITIRHCSLTDFYTIKTWWERNGQHGFTEKFLPTTSYVAEWRGEPVASISVLRTNISEYAYLENLVSNPDYPKHDRKPVIEALVAYAEKQAKELGYKKLLCLAPNDKLSKRYEEMGYTPSLFNVTVQVKELA